MKVAILGTGALGCYFAAHLHAVCELHLFGHWEDQKAAIRNHGLHYRSLDGKEKRVPVRVSELNAFPHYFDLIEQFGMGFNPWTTRTGNRNCKYEYDDCGYQSYRRGTQGR